jgi:hypothetical protein|tara:strand:- start:2504 stop:2692 length:189 start_codon:yes stop_codon:yes gene_type:complete
MTFYRLSLLVLMAMALSGCFLTKVVTVPMRIVGAVVSVVPVIGNAMDESIETVADAVDDIPL